MRFIKELIMNIRLAYYGMIFEVTDPFFKAKMVYKLDQLGIDFVEGYSDKNMKYTYGITHCPSKKTMGIFLKWFAENFPDWKYFYVKHGMFKTAMAVFIDKM